MTVRYPPPGKIKREAEHRDATAVGKMAVMAKPESSSTSVVVISILRQNTARGVVGWGFRSPGQCMFFVAYDTVCLASGLKFGNSRPHGGKIEMSPDHPPTPTQPKNVLQHKNKRKKKPPKYRELQFVK